MGALQDDTALIERDGRLTATLSRDWEIWGPNGGYLSAIALRAAGRAAPEGHKPASFSCQYLSSPPFGEVELVVTPVKSGRAAWCLNVAMVQGGRTHLQAQVWTASRTTGPEQVEAAAPDVPGPTDLQPIEAHLPPDAPIHRFHANFDHRPVRYTPWGERNPDGAHVREWRRFRGFEAGKDPFLDQARALLLIDTLVWPTFARSLSERPAYIAPSLDLSVWFHDAPGAASEWLLLDVRADAAKAGLIYGDARVWTQEGRLVATGGSHLLVVDPR